MKLITLHTDEGKAIRVNPETIDIVFKGEAGLSRVFLKAAGTGGLIRVKEPLAEIRNAANLGRGNEPLLIALTSSKGEDFLLSPNAIALISSFNHADGVVKSAITYQQPLPSPSVESLSDNTINVRQTADQIQAMLAPGQTEPV